NLRAQPNTSSEILAQIAKGTTIYVISVENNWGKVVYDSQTGYVSMTYLTPEQSVTNPIVASNDSNG
ncbi:MAG: SH3 domain-containing protein, partial [Clostridia bacterium]|nr:SH3 domain-containing protein [Clostridia bacterium]